MFEPSHEREKPRTARSEFNQHLTAFLQGYTEIRNLQISGQVSHTLDFSTEIPRLDNLPRNSHTLENHNLLSEFVNEALEVNDGAEWKIIHVLAAYTKKADTLKATAFLGADLETTVKVTPDWLNRSIEMSPAMIACACGNAEGLKILHELGANITYISSGISLLEIAAFRGHANCVKYLMESGLQPQMPFFKPANIFSNHISPVVRDILSEGFDGPKDSLAREAAFLDILRDLRDRDRLYETKVVNDDSAKFLNLMLSSDFSIDSIHEAVSIGVNPNIAFEGRRTLAGLAFKNNDFNLFQKALKVGCTSIHTGTDQHEAHHIIGVRDDIDELSLSAAIFGILDENPALFHGASLTYKSFESPSKVYLFLNSALEIRDLHPYQNGISFFQLASNLLYVPVAERPLTPIIDSIKQARSRHIDPSEIISKHPNEAEFTLLLNDPKTRDADPISNPVFRQLFGGAILPDSTAREKYRALSRIGLQTYRVEALRWDLKQMYSVESETEKTLIQSSMLEALGGVRVDESHDTSGFFTPERFGTQYLFDQGTFKFEHLTKDSYGNDIVHRYGDRTCLIAREGYMMINNPMYGLLIIRNSSSDMRERLPQTALFYPDSAHLTTDDVLFGHVRLVTSSLSPATINDPELLQRINYLLNELEAFQEYCSTQKFNTRGSAWAQTNSGKSLIGGYHSPLFGELVNRIEYFHEFMDSKHQILSLIFADRRYPMWQPHTFKDADGIKQKFLRLTPDVMRDLQNLRDLPLGGKENISETTHNFIWHAGFKNRADLVVV